MFFDKWKNTAIVEALIVQQINEDEYFFDFVLRLHYEYNIRSLLF